MPAVKNPPAIQETHKTWVQSQGQADPLEEEMAIHSSVPAWEILWAEEPGQLQSTGSQRVGHTTEHTKLNTYHSSECCTPCPLERLRFHFSLSCSGGGNGNPLQCSCLESPRDGGAWWAAIYGLHRVGHDWSDLAAVIKPQLLFGDVPSWCWIWGVSQTHRPRLKSMKLLFKKR